MTYRKLGISSDAAKSSPAELVRKFAAFNNPRNAEQRAELEAALRSKWNGVQVSAGKKLAAWGGQRSLGSLKSWLESRLARGGSSDTLIVALNCVSAVVGPGDTDWAIKAYFASAAMPFEIYWAALLSKLDQGRAFAAAILQAKSGNRALRRAAYFMACLTAKAQDRQHLAKLLDQEQDKATRKLAQAWLKNAGKLRESVDGAAAIKQKNNRSGDCS